MHIAQPVHFAIVAKTGIPVGLVDAVHDLVTQAGFLFSSSQFLTRLIIGIAHVDKPFVYKAIDQFRAAAPAVRIAMLVALLAIIHILFAQAGEDIGSHVMN